MIARRLVAAGVAAAASLFVACAASEPGRVAMVDGFRYEPDQVVIKAGESVTFVNESSDVHTVTAYEDSLPEGAEYFGSGDFESEDAARDNLEEGFIKPGEEYEVSLDQPGTYRYFCVPHESSGMRGTIIVED